MPEIHRSTAEFILVLLSHTSIERIESIEIYKNTKQ